MIKKNKHIIAFYSFLKALKQESLTQEHVLKEKCNQAQSRPVARALPIMMTSTAQPRGQVRGVSSTL